MSEKRGEKRMNKKEKKATNAKKHSNTLQLNDGTTVKASCAHRRDTKTFRYKI